LRPPTFDVNQQAWPEHVFEQVRQGIYLANKLFTERLHLEWQTKVEYRASELSKFGVAKYKANLNVVLFHVKIPESASAVVAPDIRNIDHGNVDYETLIRLNIQIAQRTNPRCKVILITDHEFLADELETDRLTIRRLDVNGAEPMFERVWAMAAYVHSSLFDVPTVFLDSDAFLLRPIHNLFANDFDVGLTHRDIVGQMPVNEGVIFANTLDLRAVQTVFESYLASYLAIESSNELQEIYKNVRRWRGGQLSINAVGGGGLVYRSLRQPKTNGAWIAYLPCSIYNLSQIDESEVVPNLRDRCAVLHLKGPRKSWVRRLLKVLD
jgi:hypothetical protein